MGLASSRIRGWAWRAVWCFSRRPLTNIVQVHPRVIPAAFLSQGPSEDSSFVFPTPPRLHRNYAKSGRPRRASTGSTSTTKEVECHVMTSARPASYTLISDQLSRKTNHAINTIYKHMGRMCRDAVQYKVADGAVDIVRNRRVEARSATIARCHWGTLTTPVATDQYVVETLEQVDENTLYTRVTLLAPDPGPPLLVLQLVQKRFRSKDRIVLAFRNIVQDAHFPVPHIPVAVRVTGWLVFSRDKENTHARTLVKFRASRRTATHGEVIAGGVRHPDTTSYLRTVASLLFQIVDTKTSFKLRKPSVTGGSQRSLQRVNSSRSNGSTASR
ncbi:Aste57867_809 [Aphanomyces stellatus]|uniref:Aste57867_809 protein n=1 Tax=Aphanomyces stellatus TaxID=120398 RepID=A0A485K680_9STRA|nr:hypothetical protein As57867_000808 [Aphanomyces stellatus]VFT78033.1 Aste57867_809 [Aphanomyces stellatus]